jgi:hypothetical protein
MLMMCLPSIENLIVHGNAKLKAEHGSRSKKSVMLRSFELSSSRISSIYVVACVWAEELQLYAYLRD